MSLNSRNSSSYILTTSGPSIANDTKNVGQKLLKKMGWTEETGLGKQRNGILDPVKASSNFGRKGFGKGIPESVSGMVQQAKYSELLKSLRKHRTLDDSSVKSNLEDQSKRSRSRLHYGKLVRAKDVSQYSRESLSIVLGVGNNTTASDSPSPQKNAVENALSNSAFGVKTFSSKVDLKDYFDMKRLSRNSSCKDVTLHNRELSPTSEAGKQVSFSLTDTKFPSNFSCVDDAESKEEEKGAVVSEEEEEEEEEKDEEEDDSIDGDEAPAVNKRGVKLKNVIIAESKEEEKGAVVSEEEEEEEEKDEEEEDDAIDGDEAPAVNKRGVKLKNVIIASPKSLDSPESIGTDDALLSKKRQLQIPPDSETKSKDVGVFESSNLLSISGYQYY